MPVARRALIVGINSYDYISELDACVADASAVSELLARHADQTPNYECRVLLDHMEDGAPITRASLREACEQLFTDFRGEVLLYFSGHGVLTPFGGHLCTTDTQLNDWGIPMQEIVQMAIASHASDTLMILDCCHSGDMGNPSSINTKTGSDPLALIRENMTVIAASRASQVSIEAGGHGLFTAALLDALEGGAADHMGWVTASSIYAYVQRRFGSWDQRPVYKSHATGVTVIRECAPLIDRLKLHKLVELFPTLDYQYSLDPEHEPEDEHGNVHGPVNQAKVDIALLFKEYRDAGLLKASIPNEQFYWTARRNHTVELTTRGREYWWLVSNNKL
jgi:Caspase domain